MLGAMKVATISLISYRIFSSTFLQFHVNIAYEKHSYIFMSTLLLLRYNLIFTVTNTWTREKKKKRNPNFYQKPEDGLNPENPNFLHLVI